METSKIKNYKETFNSKLKDEQIGLLLSRGEELNLDPFRREICLYFDRGNPVFLVTLPGCRKVTHSKDYFRGYTPVTYWEPKVFDRLAWIFDSEKQVKVLKPISLELFQRFLIGIYIDGFIEPIWGEVFTEEYLPENLNYIWQKKPITMLSKIAEVIAHRKLNPELSDLYLQEEVDSFEQVFETEVDKEQIVEDIEASLKKINKNNPAEIAVIKKLLKTLEGAKPVDLELIHKFKKELVERMGEK